MNQVILAVEDNDLSLPMGIIESPQDLMDLLQVSQATAYRYLMTIKAGINPVIDGIRFEFIDIDEDEDFSGSELSQAMKLDLLRFMHGYEIMGWKFSQDVTESGLSQYKDLFNMFSHIVDEVKHNEAGLEVMELLHYYEDDEEVEAVSYSMELHPDGLKFIQN